MAKLQLETTTARGRASPGAQAQRRAVALAVGAAGVVLVLLGHAYLQVPRLVFAAATLSGLWAGIALDAEGVDQTHATPECRTAVSGRAAFCCDAGEGRSGLDGLC